MSIRKILLLLICCVFVVNSFAEESEYSSTSLDGVTVFFPQKISQGESGFITVKMPSTVPKQSDYEVQLTYSNSKKSNRFSGFKPLYKASKVDEQRVAKGKDASILETEDNSNVIMFLLGIPCSSVVGKTEIVIYKGEEKIISSFFEIVEREFDTQVINLTPSMTSIQTEPDPRKVEQAERYQAVIANEDENGVWLDSGFIFPFAQKIRRTSLFGSSRLYIYTTGYKQKSTHAGIDYGLVKGTELFAPARGKVVLAEERIVTGNTVIIEHLPGVYTIYMHMNSIETELGKILEQGDKIGTVGMTGFATGPHLHWEMRIKGINVDPECLTRIDKLPEFGAMFNGIFEGR